MDKNCPVTFSEIEKSTGLSWTGVKKVVDKIKKNYHLKLRQSGKSWIVWKDEGPLRRKIPDSCHQFLEK